MIEPFVESQRRDGCISYGLSSYGYDARVADEFKIFTNVDSAIVDPKNFDQNSFVDRKTDVCVIPPNSFALARTVEYFRVPRDVLVICLGKSTYARCGIIVNVTPLEPGWEGHVTLEFSNTTPLPAKIYANEGACQFLFLKGNEPCETSYADRAGKYMGQRGVTLPKPLVGGIGRGGEQHQLFALLRIGPRDDGMFRPRPDGSGIAFHGGQRHHLAADLGKALGPAANGDEARVVDGDDIAGIVPAVLGRVQHLPGSLARK
jgi:dCTP deaminase